MKRKGLERAGAVGRRSRGENKGQRHRTRGAKTEGEVGRGRKYSEFKNLLYAHWHAESNLALPSGVPSP